MATRAEMRALVRNLTELESDILPDTLVDGFLNDGHERTAGFDGTVAWPFLAASWTLTTASGTDTYTLDTAEAIPNALQSVHDLSTNGYGRELQFIPWVRGHAEFGGRSGVPSHWSERAGDVVFFASPTSTRNYRVDGFKRSTWDAAASAEPVLDYRLHNPVVWWAMARVYAWQEDEILEQLWTGRWAEACRAAKQQIMHAHVRDVRINSGYMVEAAPVVRLNV